MNAVGSIQRRCRCGARPKKSIKENAQSDAYDDPRPPGRDQGRRSCTRVRTHFADRARIRTRALASRVGAVVPRCWTRLRVRLRETICPRATARTHARSDAERCRGIRRSMLATAQVETNQYTAPTISAPPRMFPIVTGRRLSAKKLRQVSPAQIRLRVETDDAVVALDQEPDRDEVHVRDRVLEARVRRRPRSAAMTARILSVVVRAPYVSQTARQTRALQSIPSAMACPKPRSVLATAIESAVRRPRRRRTCTAREADEDGGRRRAHEVADPHDRPVPEQPRGRDAPARPGHDDQVVAGEELRSRDDDQDQAERESEPARSRVTPKGTPSPDATVVAKTAPSAMKAPASTESAKTSSADIAPSRHHGRGLSSDVCRRQRVEPGRRRIAYRKARA